MEVTTPDHMIFVALINGLTERALGMAQVAAMFSDDADGNAVLERIKGEAFERMLNHEDDNLELHDGEDDTSLEELLASAPPELAAIVNNPPYEPEPQEVASGLSVGLSQAIAEAAAYAEAEAAEDNDEALLSDPIVTPAVVTAEAEELLF
jgi:hypothetical protein|tara:strand:+ start:783 stop:1235 length:453 start_codon:yes stop_codon:yes gene_type:complete